MTAHISPCNQLTNIIEIFQPRCKKEWAALGLSCATLLISSGTAIVAGIGYLGYKWATADKLPNPNTVQTIYTPPHPSKTDLLNLHLHREKIAKLNRDPQVMGITFAPDKRGHLSPIYIKCTELNAHTTYFFAHDLTNDARLGFAITHPFLKSNQYLKEGHWICGRPKEYAGYGSSPEEVGKVLLEQVTNESTYKNIGVILNKAIHQKFENECQGRIIIDAVRVTQPYHYKMGFRTADSEKNSLYAQYAKEHQIPHRDLGSVSMHLPDRARQLWLDEIHNRPIGFPDLSGE